MYKQIFINDFAKATEKEILDTYQVSDHDRALVGKIIFADYTYEDYSGSSLVIFESVDGELYEVHGSHCSCYGLEDQWEPEQTSLDYYKESLSRGANIDERVYQALGLVGLTTEEQVVKSFILAKQEYEKILGSLKEEHIFAYIKLIGKEFGNFAVVTRGYTPSFNDGEPCEHSYDYSLCVEKDSGYGFTHDDLYLEVDEDEDMGALFEYDQDSKTTINTHLKDNTLFFEVIDNFVSFLDDIHDTNYEIKAKYLDGALILDVEDYYCGY